MQYKKKRSGFKPGRFCVLKCKNFALHRGIFCRTGARAVPTVYKTNNIFVGARFHPRPNDCIEEDTGQRNFRLVCTVCVNSPRVGTRRGTPGEGSPRQNSPPDCFVSPPALFLQDRSFALCAGRPKALPLDSTTFEKVDETLNIGAFAVVGARFHPRPNDCIEEDTGQKM